jgi:hypothetical protein
MLEGTCHEVTFRKLSLRGIGTAAGCSGEAVAITCEERQFSACRPGVLGAELRRVAEGSVWAHAAAA